MISTVHGARERGGVGSSTRGEGLGQGLGRREDWGELVLKVRDGDKGRKNVWDGVGCPKGEEERSVGVSNVVGLMSCLLCFNLDNIAWVKCACIASRNTYILYLPIPKGAFQGKC